MTLLPAKRNKKAPTPSLPQEPVRIDAYWNFKNPKVHALTEFHALVMMVVFVASAFTIVNYINITVIPLLMASQILLLIGLTGFILAYLLRNKLKLSLLDGIYYNVFGIAPMLFSLFLIVNAQCTNTFTESYHIHKKEIGGSGFTFTLENGAYDDCWRIRNLDKNEVIGNPQMLNYTFCNGMFGYKVMKDRKISF